MSSAAASCPLSSFGFVFLGRGEEWRWRERGERRWREEGERSRRGLDGFVLADLYAIVSEIVVGVGVHLELTGHRNISSDWILT